MESGGGIPVGWLAVLFVVGIWVPAMLVRTHRRRAAQARAAPNWPTATGTVLISRSRAPSKGDFRSRLLYSYIVDGQQYESCTLNFDRWIKPEEAEALPAAYPPGSSVQVFYDPDDPATAVLQPLFRTKQRLGVAAALFFGTLVLFILALLATR